MYRRCAALTALNTRDRAVKLLFMQVMHDIANDRCARPTASSTGEEVEMTQCMLYADYNGEQGVV